MDTRNSATNINDRLLSRLGGAYLFWINFIYLLIVDLAGLLGILYISFATDLYLIKISFLLLLLIIFSVIANIIISLFCFSSTKNSRRILDIHFKKRAEHYIQVPEPNRNTAWKEIFYLPSRVILIDFLAMVLLVLLPTMIISRITINITTIQTVHIIIGCFVSLITILVVHSIVVDRILIPVRTYLYSQEITELRPAFFSRISSRTTGLIIFLVIITLILLAGIGFQRSTNASLPGADLSFEIRQFQIHSAILGGTVIVFGFILAILYSRSISKPIRDLLDILSKAMSGEYQHRALLISSDETSLLSNQFNNLLSSLQNSTVNLTNLVEEQTKNLKYRTNQLQVITKILQDISTADSVANLLDRSVQLISETFGFYHVGVYLSDPNSEYAVLEAASSEGGKLMKTRGYRYRIDKSNIIGVTISENKEILVEDISRDVSLSINPDLPQTKSLLAIPLTSLGKTIGALDIQSSSISSFNIEDRELLNTLSDQITLTIRNIRLVEENRLALQRLETSFEENIQRSWNELNIPNKPSFRYTPTSLTHFEAPGYSLKVESEGDLLSVPIKLHGQVLGSIDVVRKGPNPWDEADEIFTSEIATQIGLALENVRLLNSTKQRMYYEQSLSELTGQLSQSIDTNTLLETALRELHQLPNVTEVSVKLSPPEDEK